jgi:hypothetical protein
MLPNCTARNRGVSSRALPREPEVSSLVRPEEEGSTRTDVHNAGTRDLNDDVQQLAAMHIELFILAAARFHLRVTSAL